MIPNLTAAECGALLVAVGMHMIDHDVAAEAVLDFRDRAEPEDDRQALINEMIDATWAEALTQERAEQILAGVSLEDAITFNPMGT